MAQRLDSNPNPNPNHNPPLTLTLTTDPNLDPDPNQAQRLDAADETEQVSEEILRTVGNLARYALSAQSTPRSSMAKALSWQAPCASSGRAWQLWAAQHSQEEAGPLGAQPLSGVLELAASKAADFTAFDHAGRVSSISWARCSSLRCTAALALTPNP
eukprot:scaffold15763_cov50-Phaeocystis_antarctica.AAC.1